MGRSARARRRLSTSPAAPTLHDELGTEPATSAPLSDLAPGVRRVASRVGASALTAVARNLDDDQGLEALRAVPAAQAGLDVLTRQAVALARSQGASWQDVGDVFGVTRQAAFQRFGRGA